MERIDQKYLHPEDAQNIEYWTKKWGISARQLKDAILDTGSLQTASLKKHLNRNSFIHHPLQGVKTLTNNLVHSFL